MSEKQTSDQNTHHPSNKEKQPGRLQRFARSLGQRADRLLSLSREADQTPEEISHLKMLAIQGELYDATILKQDGRQHIADLTTVLPKHDGDVTIVSSQGEQVATSGHYNRQHRVMRRVGPSLQAYMVTEPFSYAGEPQPLRASRYSDYEALFDTIDGSATLTDARGIFLEKSDRGEQQLDGLTSDLTVDDITGSNGDERQRYTDEVERIFGAVSDSVTEEFRREKGI